MLEQTTDYLVVVREVGFVGGHFGLEFDDSHHLLVLGLVHHHKRRTDLTHVHVVYLPCHLGRKVLVLELRRTVHFVAHQARVHHRVLVLRELGHGRLKRSFAAAAHVGDSVQTTYGLVFVGIGDTRLEKNVAAIDTLTFLLDKLDDMIAILGLHNTTHALGVGQVESHFGKLRHQLTFAHKTQLAAAFGRLGILTVEARQHREIGRAAVDTFGIFAQTTLDSLRLLHRHRRLETQDLHLHLRRNHRQRVVRQRVVVAANLTRGGVDRLNEFLLHLLHNHLISHLSHHLLADIRTGLAEVLLHLLFRANLVEVVVHTHVHLVHHRGFVDRDRVQLGLVKIQFLNSQLLRNDTVRVAGNRCALVLRTQAFLLHFAQQNSLVADDPDHLVYDSAFSRCHQSQAQHQTH